MVPLKKDYNDISNNVFPVIYVFNDAMSYSSHLNREQLLPAV